MTPGAPTVLVIMGVSGSGKSTIAAELALRLGWPFQEGDELHPPANITKMAAGAPLDDADRAPWLALVGAWIDERIGAGECGIVTCSALRRRYRDVLRREPVLFVNLEVPRGILATRVARRPGHFMPASLLGTQVEAFEPPGPDERAITVATDAPPEQVAAAILRELGLG